MPKYNVHNTSGVGRPMLVYLDGEQVDMVLECDTDEGYIVRYVTDEHGNLERCGDEIATETLRGSVSVEPDRK